MIIFKILLLSFSENNKIIKTMLLLVNKLEYKLKLIIVSYPDIKSS